MPLDLVGHTTGRKPRLSHPDSLLLTLVMHSCTTHAAAAPLQYRTRTRPVPGTPYGATVPTAPLAAAVRHTKRPCSRQSAPSDCGGTPLQHRCAQDSPITIPCTQTAAGSGEAPHLSGPALGPAPAANQCIPTSTPQQGTGTRPTAPHSTLHPPWHSVASRLRATGPAIA